MRHSAGNSAGASTNGAGVQKDSTRRAMSMNVADHSDDPSARRVVMLVANEFLHDTRVHKQARSLIEWGCEVHVIAMARADLRPYEVHNEIIVHRIEPKPASLFALLFSMLFWKWPAVFRRLVQPLDRSDPIPAAVPQRPPTPAADPATPSRKAAIKQRFDKTPRLWQFLSSPLQFARYIAWKSRRFLGRLGGSAGSLLSLNWEMARLALALKPTIVESHDCNTLLAGAIVKRIAGVPLVYDSHELFLARNIAGRSRWRDWFTWRPIERFCIHQCDVVMSVAQGICDYLAAKYRIPKPRLLRNVQPYEPPPEKTRLLSEELGIPHSVSIVIYPGAITINRGLEVMIDSATRLQNAAYVVMGYAGNPNYLAQLKQRAVDRGVLGTRVFFRDAVPIHDVVRYTASADLGIVPTQNVCLSYSFEASNKIFHCLMAGVPLAMSDHPEKRMIVEQFGVGVLFDETDPIKISDAVNDALTDRTAYERMRRNCLDAARVLNWEHEEHTLRTIFAELLGNSALPIPQILVPDHVPVISVEPVAEAVAT